MTRARRSHDIRRIAAAQDLKAADCRDRLLRACGDTDDRARERDADEAALARSIGRLDSLYDAARLDLDRLAIAAADIRHHEDRLERSAALLEDARESEAAALGAWTRADLVADWLTDEGRRLERGERRLLDDKRAQQAVSLRLSGIEERNAR